MDFEECLEIIEYAIKQKNEDLMMQRWIMHYQGEMGFEEFKCSLEAKVEEDNQTEDEILDMVKGILG